jgi:ribosomal protein S18 acetylase RimI-like enzyme
MTRDRQDLLVNKSLTRLLIMSILSLDTRRAEISDAIGISAIHDASWRHAYTGLIPHRALDTMIRRRDSKWWARAIRNSTRVLVLESEGHLVGYTTIGPNRVSALSQEGEVYELYLLPEYQGVGIGKKLFLAAREELLRLKFRGCVVWVLEENQPAVQFYRNAGGADIAEGNETFDAKSLNKIAFAWY